MIYHLDLTLEQVQDLVSAIELAILDANEQILDSDYDDYDINDGLSIISTMASIRSQLLAQGVTIEPSGLDALETPGYSNPTQTTQNPDEPQAG